MTQQALNFRAQPLHKRFTPAMRIALAIPNHKAKRMAASVWAEIMRGALR